MDMELDCLDFDNDKIKNYLKNKLDEIKFSNEKLKKTLRERQEYCQKLLNRPCQSTVEVSLAWKKIFNGKYSIGYKIKSNLGTLDDFKVFLKWDSKYTLFFKVDYYKTNFKYNKENHCGGDNCKILTSTLIKTNQLSENSYVVITVDIPKFLEKIKYDLDGNLHIRNENQEEVNVLLPTVPIVSSDIANRTLTDCSVIDGEPEHLAAVISCSEQMNLILILPSDWESNLDSTFEIHCSLTKIDTADILCKQYYYVNRVAPMFNDSILEIHPIADKSNEFKMRMYSRNNESFLHFLHHLYNCITDVLIIPEILYDNYLVKQSDSLYCYQSKNEEKFKQCADREIAHVEGFLQTYQNSISSCDISSFRNGLAELERETDLMYLRINNQKNFDS